MGNGSPAPVEWVPLKKLHLISGVFALVVLGVAIRVVGLTQPFIDFWSWRQSDVAMIAENFSRNGFPRDFGSPVAEDVEAIRQLETLRREGARYLVFLRHTMWWFDQYPDFARAATTSYRRVQETEDYVIFDLSPRTRD
jgi:hypothetical protein